MYVSLASWSISLDGVKGSSLVEHLAHVCLELCKTDIAILVSVHLPYKLIPNSPIVSFCSLRVSVENLLEVSLRYDSGTRAVKNVESSQQVFIREKIPLVASCRDEFCKVDCPVIVDVDCFEHLDHVWLLHLEEAADLSHVLSDLIFV